MSDTSEITRIFSAIREGRPNSSNELFPLVYAELRKLAEAKLKREMPGQTLQPTALVHEVFLRLVAPNDQRDWDSIGHFFSAAANAMRRILIDTARKKNSLKRGGDCNRLEIEVDELAFNFDDEELIRLDEALEKFACEDPIKAQLVELRFFGGMSVEQSCEILKISRATHHRYWNFARAWLFLQLTNHKTNESQNARQSGSE